MTVFIFIMGTLVTLMVIGAISLLIYAAILDGRTEEAERKKRLAVVQQESGRPGGGRSAA